MSLVRSLGKRKMQALLKLVGMDGEVYNTSVPAMATALLCLHFAHSQDPRAAAVRDAAPVVTSIARLLAGCTREQLVAAARQDDGACLGSRLSSEERLRAEALFGVKLVYIPGGCTGVAQPADVGLQRPLKALYQQLFCDEAKAVERVVQRRYTTRSAGRSKSPLTAAQIERLRPPWRTP
ncbi:hypothetical protein ABPG77_010005 [Micractinium sp. CCAP 211/92]